MSFLKSIFPCCYSTQVSSIAPQATTVNVNVNINNPPVTAAVARSLAWGAGNPASAASASPRGLAGRAAASSVAMTYEYAGAGPGPQSMSGEELRIPSIQEYLDNRYLQARADSPHTRLSQDNSGEEQVSGRLRPMHFSFSVQPNQGNVDVAFHFNTPEMRSPDFNGAVPSSSMPAGSGAGRPNALLKSSSQALPAQEGYSLSSDSAPQGLKAGGSPTKVVKDDGKRRQLNTPPKQNAAPALGLEPGAHMQFSRRAPIDPGLRIDPNALVSRHAAAAPDSEDGLPQRYLSDQGIHFSIGNDPDYYYQPQLSMAQAHYDAEQRSSLQGRNRTLNDLESELERTLDPSFALVTAQYPEDLQEIRQLFDKWVSNKAEELLKK
jgi:hypothetical protein